MRVRLLQITVVAALTGIGGSAYADIYAAGPAYGANPTGGTVVCRVVNVGTTSISIPTRQIITNINTLITPTSDTCNVSIPPNGNCGFTAPVTGNFALSCRLVATGTDPQISGTLDVQNPIGTVRVVVPMQKTSN